MFPLFHFVTAHKFIYFFKYHYFSVSEVDSKVNDVSNTVSAQQLHLEKRLRVKALATPAVRKIAKENNVIHQFNDSSLI